MLLVFLNCKLQLLHNFILTICSFSAIRSDLLVNCPTVSNYFLYGETNIMHCNTTFYGHPSWPFYVTCYTMEIVCSEFLCE